MMWIVGTRLSIRKRDRNHSTGPAPGIVPLTMVAIIVRVLSAAELGHFEERRAQTIVSKVRKVSPQRRGQFSKVKVRWRGREGGLPGGV